MRRLGDRIKAAAAFVVMLATQHERWPLPNPKPALDTHQNANCSFKQIKATRAACLYIIVAAFPRSDWS
jgi:hypothetical protein